jgi:hypothetical protein
MENMGFNGEFRWQVREADGSIALDEQGVPREGTFRNANTNAGLNSILGIMFHGDTQITTWYLGLVDDSGFSTFAVGDTMASHAGWTETSTYSDGTRRTWSADASSGQAITNSTPATFNINGTVTVHGAFLVSNSTKGGTSGTLWATGAFSSPQALVNGQTLTVTYSCSAS